MKKVIFGVYEIQDNDVQYKLRKPTKSKNKKIVALMRSKNSSNYIKTSLKTINNFSDAIVFYDDNSQDNTLEIVESLKIKFNIEKIITTSKWKHQEGEDRELLLKAGRMVGGTHFICLDDDEIFTSNFINNDFLKRLIYSLKPGDKIELRWFQLWRDSNRVRTDGSIWGKRYYKFIYCDDKKTSYQKIIVHEPRLPEGLKGKTIRLISDDFGVVHFNFANWRNVLIKQSWYMCLERISYPEKSDDTINQRYANSLNESGLKSKEIPTEWFSNYPNFNEKSFLLPNTWREAQIMEWFGKYGREFFSGLNIWDIDWGE